MKRSQAMHALVPSAASACVKSMCRAFRPKSRSPGLIAFLALRQFVNKLAASTASLDYTKLQTSDQVGCYGSLTTVPIGKTQLILRKCLLCKKNQNPQTPFPFASSRLGMLRGTFIEVHKMVPKTYCLATCAKFAFRARVVELAFHS